MKKIFLTLICLCVLVIMVIVSKVLVAYEEAKMSSDEIFTTYIYPTIPEGLENLHIYSSRDREATTVAYFELPETSIELLITENRLKSAALDDKMIARSKASERNAEKRGFPKIGGSRSYLSSNSKSEVEEHYAIIDSEVSRVLYWVQRY